MGFRQAALLVSSCFFLGVLFVCFNVDHRILFQTPVTEDAIRDAFQFYTTFFNAPPAIRALLHGMMGVTILSLIAKLHKWDDSAMYFDGGSLAVSVFAIAIYTSVIIPAMRTIVEPVPDVDTYTDQVEALQLLSAGNVIAIVLLGAVLVLQVGQEWARRVDEAADREAAKEVQTSAPESKKEK